MTTTGDREPLLRIDGPIRTDRLILRTLTPDDIGDFEAYASRPDVLRYLPWPLRDSAGIAEHLSRRLSTTLVTDGDVIVLGIVLTGDRTEGDHTESDHTESDHTANYRTAGDHAESDSTGSDNTSAAPSAENDTTPHDGRVIGDLTLRLLSAEDGQAEIGWVLHPDFQGNGYASEAALKLLHVAFDDLGAHRVVANLDARNHDSAKLCHRLGLRQEGHFVHDHHDEDGWADSLVFAILDAEWKARIAIDGA